MALLRVAFVNQYRNYEQGLLFRILQSLPSVATQITDAANADLIIQGPYPPAHLSRSLTDRVIRRGQAFATRWLRAGASRQRPVTVYHTWENTRYDSVPFDFSFSSDLGVTDPHHCRFPVWMGSLDWTHEGIAAVPVPRFGAPIRIDTLLEPIGEKSAARKRMAFAIASHLRQPRRELVEAVRTVMDLDGYGPAFDKDIVHHDASGFDKRDISLKYRFALCPENSMYPGYYTEKVVEAFACGCIPLTWCDGNVGHDFTPAAMLNLADCASEGYSVGLRRLLSEECEDRITREPLMKSRPTLEPVRTLLSQAVEAALGGRGTV